MRLSIVLTCGVLFLSAVTMAPRVTRAVDEGHGPLARRVSDSSTDWYDVRTEMESLRTRLDAMERGAADDKAAGDGCGCCGNCCCDPCCRSEGWLAGAEIIWLKPHNNNGVGVPGVFGNGGGLGVIANDGHVDPELEESYRLWLGYSLCDGLGARVRYWEFDHNAQNRVATALPGEQNTVFHAWDTWVLDFEVTKSTRFGCDMDATFSFGIRFLEYDESAGLLGGGGPLTSRLSFDGEGFTMGTELRAPVNGIWGVFVGARASAMYGDDTYFANTGIGEELQQFQQDVVKFIYEIQGGLEYTSPFDCCGGYYFLRIFVEAQYWDGFGADHSGNLQNALVLGAVPAPVSVDGAAGFVGFGVSVGIVR